MDIIKSKLIIGCIFLPCIFQCGSATPLINNQVQSSLITAHDSDDFVTKLNEDCASQFQRQLENGTILGTKSWENRGRKNTEGIKDTKNIDHILAYIQTLKYVIALNKGNLQCPEDIREFLIKKAKEIAKLEEPSEQEKYWGNLEFYLASYAVSLILIVQNIATLKAGEKKAKYKEIIDAFYEAYTTAFKLISGIDLENNPNDAKRMDFRTMCNTEERFKVSLFSDEDAGDLCIVVGAPICIIEYLALLKKHPVTGEPATMANLGRGNGIVAAKDLSSAYSLDDNMFVLSFCLHFCDYVRRVINEINDILVIYEIPWQKVPKVQEDKKFLFKDFRNVVDLRKEKILFFNKLIQKEDNGQYTFIPNPYVQIRNNLLEYGEVWLDEKGNFDETNVEQIKEQREMFKTLFSINVLGFIISLTNLANKYISGNITTQNGRITFNPILLPTLKKKLLPV